MIGPDGERSVQDQVRASLRIRMREELLASTEKWMVESEWSLLVYSVGNSVAYSVGIPVLDEVLERARIDELQSER